MLKENNKFLTFGEKMDKESTQSDKRYIQDLTRLSGNQVGTALREPNNKALHQATLFSTGTADYISDKLPEDLISDVLTAEEIGEKLNLAINAHILSTTAADSGLVHTTGDEAIDGVKSFAVLPETMPLPSRDVQMVNKKYVDQTARAYAKDEASKVVFDPLTCFPVGSIYMSLQNINPSQLFGGVWKALDQGRVLIGAGAQYPVNSSGGEATHAISLAEMPAHSHAGTAASAGSHTHTGSTSSAGYHSHGGSTSSAGSHTHTGSTSSAGSHTHAGSAATAGAHSHTFTYKTKWGSPELYFYEGPHAINSGKAEGGNVPWGTISTDGSHSHRLSIESAGDHTHSMRLNASGEHNHAMSLYSAGSHTHSMNLNQGGAHTHTLSITSTGGGNAMSLMQPYLSVYMWTRIA